MVKLGVSICSVGSYIVSPLSYKAFVTVITRNSSPIKNEWEDSTRWNPYGVGVILLVLLVVFLAVMGRLVLFHNVVVQWTSFFDNIVRFLNVLTEIISNRTPRFTAFFLQDLQHSFGALSVMKSMLFSHIITYVTNNIAIVLASFAQA